MQVIKNLIPLGGSKAVILPKDWLDQYGNIDQVILEINGNITVIPCLHKENIKKEDQ